MQTAETTRRPPRKRRKTRWKYGQESDFKLLVFTGNSWLQPLYSHDVPNKAIAKGSRAEFSELEKIERLKKLFAKGGTRGNSFNPMSMEYAVVLPNFGKISEAIEYWTPASGWRAVQKSQNNTTLSRDWRLWMAGTQSQTFIPDIKSDEFQQYALNLPANRPDLMTRYADPESGELPQSLLICLYLGQVAKRKQAGGKISRAYIYYNSDTSPVLRIDLSTGRLCGIGQGSGWVSPEFFFTR